MDESMVPLCELAGVFLFIAASTDLGSLLSLATSSTVTVISSPITFDSAKLNVTVSSKLLAIRMRAIIWLEEFVNDGLG
jgi:hypothetical protein